MIEEFYNEFYSWLTGLIEDDPIPYEIKTLVFFVNNNNEIGFSGTEEENPKLVDEFFYFPLEAQYFYCPKLYKQKNVIKILEQLLKMLKKDKYFKNFNIFFGKLYKIANKVN